MSCREARLGVSAILLVTVLVRLPTLWFPQPIDDEAVYAVVANEIVHGGRPYVDAIERKPPLLFWTYAAIFKATGDFNWTALHLVAIGWVLATLAGLFVLTRRLFGIGAALVAALLYSVYQPWGLWKNLAFNGEVMMLLPVVWAWVIALGPSRSRWRIELAAAGALLCAGFLLKQPAAIAAVPLGLYVLHPHYRLSRRCSVLTSLGHAAMLTSGFFVALAAVAVVLRSEGILNEAFYWTITNHESSYFFWNRALENTAAFAAACLPVWLAAAYAIGSDAIWFERAAERFAVSGWLIVAAVGVVAGGRFYPHYYIQLLPSLVVAAAPPLAKVWRGEIGRSRLRLAAHFSRGWVALAAVGFLVGNTIGLIAQQPGTDSGRYLREHAEPRQAHLFVWGQAPRVYVDARLRPSSRYVATFPLTGYIFGPRLEIDTSGRIVPGSWANLAADFAARPPDYIVDAEIGPDGRYPIAHFPLLAGLLNRQYRLAARTRDGDVYERIVSRRSEERSGTAP